MTAKAKAYGNAAYGNYESLAGFNRFADNRFCLGDETELFSESFCKFFNSHVFNIRKIVSLDRWVR